VGCPPVLFFNEGPPFLDTARPLFSVGEKYLPYGIPLFPPKISNRLRPDIFVRTLPFVPRRTFFWRPPLPRTCESLLRPQARFFSSAAVLRILFLRTVRRPLCAAFLIGLIFCPASRVVCPPEFCVAATDISLGFQSSEPGFCFLKVLL